MLGGEEQKIMGLLMKGLHVTGDLSSRAELAWKKAESKRACEASIHCKARP